jgi:DNA modification methylase
MRGDMKNTIIQGDCLEVLKTLPSGSVNCVVTSPPYWALRDYGVDGQLGLEPTFQEYINKLCDIFDEVKRVLRKDGTCWVNIGDTYGQNWRGGGVETASDIQKGNWGTVDFMGKKAIKTGVPPKSLLQIPSRFAIEMSNRGWILRNEIIWYKPNCMPSSVKDRFTVDFEKVFFFVKNKKYWFETQLENAIEIYSPERAKRPETSKMKAIHSSGKPAGNFTTNKLRPDNKRNKRCVWRVTTKPLKEAHFAVYPEKLIEPMIKAGCPKGGIVLDPFIGSGTTAIVALKQGKNYIGIELNPEYICLADKRIKSVPQELFI